MAGHVHLRVGDLDQARAFYSRLGLEESAPYEGTVFLGSDGYHHHIAANTWYSLGAPPRAPNSRRLSEIVMEAQSQAMAGLTWMEVGPSGCLSSVDPWGHRITVRPAHQPFLC